LQRGEIELLGRLLTRQPADQSGQQIALHRQLLLQWRQCRLHLRQSRLDRRHFGAGHLAELELPPQDAERLGSILMISSVAAICPRNDASCTAAATTFRGQCQIGGLELEPLKFGLRRQRLDLPPDPAEDIRL